MREPWSTHTGISMARIGLDLMVAHHAGGTIHWEIADLDAARFSPDTDDALPVWEPWDEVPREPSE